MNISRILPVCLTLAVCGVGYAQSFPFDEDFSNYAPGSTGAPAWSVLRSGHWNVEGGGLNGPVLARFNLRPPRHYTSEITVDPSAGDAPTTLEAGFVFNAQDELKMGVADGVNLLWSRSASGVAAKLRTSVDGIVTDRNLKVDASNGPIRLRLVVDADAGRFAVFVGEAKAYAGACEYPSGLLAVALNGELGRLKRFSLRVPTTDERRALMLTTLFNDPRDIADGGDGTILVLHRGSPAVLAVSRDGEIKRSFGRRVQGPLADPVAMAIGKAGEVLVLNRYPGEVIKYDPNGGIRGRFGQANLKAPSDMAVLEDGSVYVVDHEGSEGMVHAFDTDGRYLGKTIWGNATGSGLGRIATDGSGNVVVTWPGGGGAVMRPGRDRLPVLVREDPLLGGDMVGTPAAQFVCGGGVVSTRASRPNDALGFHGYAIGGLGNDCRLASVGETLYVLDREHSRIVSVPADLKDAKPEVTFQNISGSAALVSWTSPMPEATSRVHLLRGSTWITITQKYPKPSNKHQVPLDRLQPGRTYTYNISPTEATVPPSDWSIDYTFQTPGAEVKP